jgi:hypothetical protein
LVLGSASALADNSPSVKGTTATAREAKRTFILLGELMPDLSGALFVTQEMNEHQ